MLARHYGIDVPINTTHGKHTFESLATELLPPGQASAFNQAMMDFGATWCTPRSPRCIDCPVAGTCDALHTGRIHLLPVKERKLKVKERHFAYIYIRYKGKTALRRRPAGDIWQGLWEPLFVEDAPLPDLGCPLTLLASGVKHVLTHRVLLADFYLAEPQALPALPEGYIWVEEPALPDYALPRLVERMLDLLPQG